MDDGGHGGAVALGGLGVEFGLIERLYRRAVVAPLRRLYLRGPRLWGWGFWGGAAVEDICASISNAPARFWSEHLDACADLIARDVDSLVVICETVLYFYVLFNVALVLWRILAQLISRGRPPATQTERPNLPETPR